MTALLHVARRELAARWILLPAAIAIGTLAMAAIRSIGHVRGDADSIMNGTWVGTLVISTVVGMSLLGDELTNSRLSFYFARPFTPRAIFGGKLLAGTVIALVVQIAIVFLVALALPDLSWRGSALAQRAILSVGAERVFATVGCILLGMAASIALGSRTRWFVVDALGLATVGVLATWFTLRLEPDPAWLPDDSIRSAGEKALFHAAAYAIAAIGLGVATARALVQGRTDRMRAHRTLSTTLWPIVIPAMAAAAFVGELSTPPVADPDIVDLEVARASSESPIATVDSTPPYLLVVDESGGYRLGAAASWRKLDAGRIRLSRPTKVFWELLASDGMEEPLRRFLWARLNEGSYEGALAVASISLFEAELERAQRLDAERVRKAEANHPGFAGVLSQHHATRQLRSRHVDSDSHLARMAGVLGMSVDRNGPGYPHSHTSLFGVKLDPKTGVSAGTMLVGTPSTKVTSLFGLLNMTWAMYSTSIGVFHAGKLRPLGFALSPQPNWRAKPVIGIEARVSRAKIVVEAVPSTPTEVSRIEDLENAIANVRDAHGGGGHRVRLDLLLDDDVDLQQLVDVLATLDLASIELIGIGRMPGPVDLALRGHHIPTATMTSTCRHGHEWDAYSIPPARATRQQVAIARCYDDLRRDEPNAAGVVAAAVFVDVDGRVIGSTSSGVAPTLSECVERALRTLTFQKPERAFRFGLHTFEIAFRP